MASTPSNFAEDNLALVASSFLATLSNAARRKVRATFPLPELRETCCLPLDLIFKSSFMAAEVKVVDAGFARIHAFMLDSVDPLIQFLKATEDNPDDPGITMEEAKSALADAVKLLSNASAQISHLLQRKMLKAVNLEIQDLADEDIFATTCP